jgi:hypothetical protein
MADQMKSRRFVRKVATVAALGGLLAAAVPAAADAATAARPSVRFSFVSNQVSSGTRPQVRYRARHLPSGSGVYLQWRYGPDNAWTYLQTLSGGAGTVAIPADPAGVFDYRIRVLHGQHVVAVSRSRFLSVAQSSSGCDVCQIVDGLGPVAAALLGILFG